MTDPDYIPSVGRTRTVSRVYMGRDTLTDAFGRMRVSNPETLFDYQSQYDVGSLLWEDDLTGSATVTHNTNKSSVDLNVTTASGDKVIRQTRQYHRYQPGKSQYILLTFSMASGQASMEQRAGYYDAQNGFFIKEENGAISLVKRTYTSGSAVDTEVAQADWNVDRMDGTDTSRKTLDITKSQILFIDMEWLGVGGVQIGFVIDRILYPAHVFNHANEQTTVYITTANLPLRYEIENTGTVSGSASMEAICGCVMSEGGFETSRGLPFCKSSDYTSLTSLANDTRTPILSIRPKATFNSITNRGLILPQSVKGFADTTGALFEVVYNGSLTGASFASVNSDSIVESDVAATAITGGIVIDAVPVPATDAQGNNTSPAAGALGVLSRLPLTLDVAGSNPINLTLCATRIGGAGTSEVAGTVFWQELR